jgi:hypothetical protein
MTTDERKDGTYTLINKVTSKVLQASTDLKITAGDKPQVTAADKTGKLFKDEQLWKIESSKNGGFYIVNVGENCQITLNAEDGGEGKFSCVKGDKSEFQTWEFCNGFVVKKEELPPPKPEPKPEPPKPEPKPEVKPCAAVGFIQPANLTYKNEEITMSSRWKDDRMLPCNPIKSIKWNANWGKGEFTCIHTLKEDNGPWW